MSNKMSKNTVIPVKTGIQVFVQRYNASILDPRSWAGDDNLPTC